MCSESQGRVCDLQMLVLGSLTVLGNFVRTVCTLVRNGNWVWQPTEFCFRSAVDSVHDLVGPALAASTSILGILIRSAACGESLSAKKHRWPIKEVWWSHCYRILHYEMKRKEEHWKCLESQLQPRDQIRRTQLVHLAALQSHSSASARYVLHFWVSYACTKNHCDRYPEAANAGRERILWRSNTIKILLDTRFVGSLSISWKFACGIVVLQAKAL